ncbi:uncharacterized protein TrAFT101_004659 [Trichoderma asperellum]|uniref:SMP-30/Gluconolactonase/LRE-like region domain-containing protein n=1 Tax=Trichoderma asperellum (strain ATCC 204424 / CBS 433.97 / NBRC 101777) TaxID=1042311 RepID=A0A2T3Z667_TRIA4|nr:hypothetical protein M441DRAFT_59090 [Trichoderma asperellum CBS 433.97]PTB40292.1 hypothetical protein M441DRAFT_59090 [Trichoderma asperellum CBS 433.97]UKZ89614.1 hypothetical protein TrAFT101_004659 [Trichoderma asperellum]
MISSLIIIACELLTLAVSLTAPSASIRQSRRLDTHLLPNRVIAQFPAGIWIENIAVRSNGNLLLTSFLPNATLYEVSDLDCQTPTVTRLFTVDAITSFFGITETSEDVFAVAGGNFSQSAGIGKGSSCLWSVDFTYGQPSYPELIATLPDAALLNGATTVPQKNHLVLVADSILNAIWRVDMKQGRVDKAAQFLPERESSSAVNIGINGIHIHDGYLWFTNDTATANPVTGALETSMYRIKVDDNGGAANGASAEKVLTLPSGAIDDFTYGPGERNVKWIAANKENKVFAATPDGKYAVIAGASNSFEVATATACKFGRTRADSYILYVSTGGGTINGTTEGGKVQAIDTTGFRV